MQASNEFLFLIFTFRAHFPFSLQKQPTMKGVPFKEILWTRTLCLCPPPFSVGEWRVKDNEQTMSKKSFEWGDAEKVSAIHDHNFPTTRR
ncbi:hypothetical protein CEXT_465311 [Caerostris extrusa]|uniref:Uncharacterized protein n=1 Tax=Caerostris extrusa TaxID=172846 RepID=A0AAV4PBP4_CAEEX|nr:hypothetical protein CEXT_465311 [Caerostris extrusa]